MRQFLIDFKRYKFREGLLAMILGNARGWRWAIWGLGQTVYCKHSGERGVSRDRRIPVSHGPVDEALEGSPYTSINEVLESRGSEPFH